MKVKEFKSFDEYVNYVESDSYNELVPTIIIDENYCAIDFTTYCKSWKTAIRRAMKIFIKYEDVYNWLDGMKESCENNCFIDRSVYDGKYTGDYTFGVEEASDGVFYIYLKYRSQKKMKSEIIKYAMSKIGTKRVSTLDGMTLEYKNKCYNIYVDDNNVTVEEIKEESEETEKHYADYTAEDFIKSGIAKECTTCPDFCEEYCIENAECARGNDVFDGCKAVKDVMEVKQELNARFGKEQYFDTDSLQPNKTITAKIENINHCPNQNTCCIVSPLVHCDYNYKSDSCIKAHKNFIHNCEQVHKQMKAKHNPEWHHVSLATLANIDFDTLDEKRKLVCDINQILKDGIRNLYKCENHISFEVLERYVIRKCDELIQHNRLKAFWFSYIARQLEEVRRNTIYLYTPYSTAHRNRY